MGAGIATKYSNDPRSINWTDGAPTASGTNNKNGVYVSGVRHGFAFMAPADTSLRTLVVHVGGWSSGGQLTAHLSDGSTLDFNDVTSTASGQYDRNYTLSYHAATAGQTLSVTWKMTSGSGNVTLSAAALVGASSTAFATALQASVTHTSGLASSTPVGCRFPFRVQAPASIVSCRPAALAAGTPAPTRITGFGSVVLTGAS